MLIPLFNQSGVLPPIASEDEATSNKVRSPYKTSILEVCNRFSTSSHRVSLLKGLIEYRTKLRYFGIEEGFQWLDGSFVEDCETYRNRPPNDIDIVTFLRYPEQLDIDGFFKELVDTQVLKDNYYCDGYYVNIDNVSIDNIKYPPEYLIEQTCYWFGLFTHQRESFVWKGILEIPLNDIEDKNDSRAIEFLQEIK